MYKHTYNVDQTIARILSGEASLQDYFSLSDWLHENQKNRDEFALLKNYWEAEVSFNLIPLPEVSAQKTLLEIKKREGRRRLANMRRRILPIAAAVALLFTISVSIYRLNRPSASPSVHYTYLSGDTKAEFYLEDSTKVVLNKHSKLSCSGRYGKELRSVELDGEAYFEVVKNPGLPFEVDFGDAKISVLGTTFLAKGSRNDDRITATLLSGSIRFETSGQQVVLAPNQQLAFSRLSNVVDVHSVDPGEETAWKDGLLRYKSVTFGRLISELSEYYQIKIVIRNQALLDSSILVSGSFDREQPVEQVLKVVSKSLPVRFKQIKGIYYIE
jgi:ferric-dicitrate binding protein FerR (iron transport regulator)